MISLTRKQKQKVAAALGFLVLSMASDMTAKVSWFSIFAASYMQAILDAYANLPQEEQDLYCTIYNNGSGTWSDPAVPDPSGMKEYYENNDFSCGPYFRMILAGFFTTGFAVASILLTALIYKLKDRCAPDLKSVGQRSFDLVASVLFAAMNTASSLLFIRFLAVGEPACIAPQQICEKSAESPYHSLAWSNTESHELALIAIHAINNFLAALFVLLQINTYDAKRGYEVIEASDNDERNLEPRQTARPEQEQQQKKDGQWYQYFACC